MKRLEIDPDPAEQVPLARNPVNPLARARQLLEYLPHVREIAHRIHDRLPAQIPVNDLIDAGVVGLVESIEKFDPARDGQIKCYVTFCIRAAVLESLRVMDWSPRHLRRQTRYIEAARLELQSRDAAVVPTPQTAVERTINLDEFWQLLGGLRTIERGELPAEPADSLSGKVAADCRSGTGEQDPFVRCLREEIKALTADALAGLDQSSRLTLSLYYLEELTMEEVGAILGVSESSVSQIHSAALDRLRSGLEDMLSARMHAVLSPAFSGIVGQVNGRTRPS